SLQGSGAHGAHPASAWRRTDGYRWDGRACAWATGKTMRHPRPTLEAAPTTMRLHLQGQVALDQLADPLGLAEVREVGGIRHDLEARFGDPVGDGPAVLWGRGRIVGGGDHERGRADPGESGAQVPD